MYFVFILFLCVLIILKLILFKIIIVNFFIYWYFVIVINYRKEVGILNKGDFLIIFINILVVCYGILYKLCLFLYVGINF